METVVFSPPYAKVDIKVCCPQCHNQIYLCSSYFDPDEYENSLMRSQSEYEEYMRSTQKDPFETCSCGYGVPLSTLLQINSGKRQPQDPAYYREVFHIAFDMPMKNGGE